MAAAQRHRVGVAVVAGLVFLLAGFAVLQRPSPEKLDHLECEFSRTRLVTEAGFAE
jgi:hypothetical protein